MLHATMSSEPVVAIHNDDCYEKSPNSDKHEQKNRNRPDISCVTKGPSDLA